MSAVRRPSAAAAGSPGAPARGAPRPAPEALCAWRRSPASPPSSAATGPPGRRPAGLPAWRSWWSSPRRSAPRSSALGRDAACRAPRCTRPRWSRSWWPRALALVAAGLPVRLLRPGALGRARPRAGPRPGRHPHGGVALRGRRRVGAAGDPARRPAAAGLAAALAFWPAAPRPRAAARRWALVALLVLYGIPVTEHDPGAPLVRGLVLFLLVAAWLWLPRMSAREAAPAAVDRAGGRASWRCPLAARLDAETRGDRLPVVELVRRQGRDLRLEPHLRAARLVARGHHPAPRQVEQAAVLEGRDARQLRRPALGALAPRTTAPGRGGELPARARSAAGTSSFRVTVRSLRTDFVIGAGTPYLVTGAGGAGERLGRRHAAPARRAARARRQLHGARLRARPDARARCAPAPAELRPRPAPVHARRAALRRARTR